jgi:hypothetical protein
LVAGAASADATQEAAKTTFLIATILANVLRKCFKKGREKVRDWTKRQIEFQEPALLQVNEWIDGMMRRRALE